MKGCSGLSNGTNLKDRRIYCAVICEGYFKVWEIQDGLRDVCLSGVSRGEAIRVADSASRERTPRQRVSQREDLSERNICTS
jgi:hypothetical protein